QLHRVKILACLKAHSELVNGRDVLVSQRRSGARFADKACARISASLSDVGFNDLQGDFALKRRVSGAIRDAHRATAKLAEASIRVTIDFIHTKAHAPSESVRS